MGVGQVDGGEGGPPAAWGRHLSVQLGGGRGQPVTKLVHTLKTRVVLAALRQQVTRSSSVIVGTLPWQQRWTGARAWTWRRQRS